MPKNDLKPCPFCGSDEIYITWYEQNKKYSIGCNNCPVDMFGYETDEEAAKAWNKRAGAV